MSLKDRFANHSDTPEEQPQPEEQKSVELYDTPGHARNVCFVQESGVMTFLNYAYLVSGQYNPETSVITLGFTTHTVSLNGHDLGDLYVKFQNQEIRRVLASGSRYTQKEIENQPFVKEIIVNIQ
jgi:hypothetical protein